MYGKSILGEIYDIVLLYYVFIMSFLDMQLLCLGDITKNGCLATFSIPLTVGGWWLFVVEEC